MSISPFSRPPFLVGAKPLFDSGKCCSLSLSARKYHRGVKAQGNAARKAVWRRAYLATRSARRVARGNGGGRNISASAKEELDALIGENLPGIILAGYQPLPSEVDVRPLLQRWVHKGGEVIVPTADAMSRGRYAKPRWQTLGGRPIPQGLSPSLTGATAILIPGLAYGEDGRRLGRGAGWYDRALTAAGKGSLLIGVAFDSDVVPAGTIPVEDHDHNVGFILTPSSLRAVSP